MNDLRLIGVIGFNIFSAGGTTRSNINLIKEFLKDNYDIKFFNYIEFNKYDVINLLKKESISGRVDFLRFEDILNEKIDVLIITRESFFPIAKIVKSKNPFCKVIGEIHAPLDLIEDYIEENFNYIDCIRVSTETIKLNFIKKYNYKHVFAHSVSLDHLSELNYEKDVETKNLAIYSRFDEGSKDISYAIELIDYLVNNLKYEKVKLFINGYGPDEVKYHKMISKMKLENNVFINRSIPKDYIYLSTSKYETFGYSIIESIVKGHRAVLYEGEDKVIKEIYGAFKMVRWITKQVESDAINIIDYLEEKPNKTDYDHDQEKIKCLKSEFPFKYLHYINEYSKRNDQLTKPLNENEIQEIYQMFISRSKSKSILKKIEFKILDTPILRGIVINKKVKSLIKLLLGKK